MQLWESFYQKIEKCTASKMRRKSFVDKLEHKELVN